MSNKIKTPVVENFLSKEFIFAKTPTVGIVLQIDNSLEALMNLIAKHHEELRNLKSGKKQHYFKLYKYILKTACIQKSLLKSIKSSERS